MANKMDDMLDAIKNHQCKVLDEASGKLTLCEGVGVTFKDELVCIFAKNNYRISNIYIDEYDVIHVSESQYGKVSDKDIQEYNNTVVETTNGIKLVKWCDGDITSYKKKESSDSVFSSVMNVVADVMEFLD